MNIDLTEEQTNIVRDVREFCQKEFKPKLALELDKKEEFPLNLYKKAAVLGFTSVSFPKDFGGRGLGQLETCLVFEEMCRVDSSLGVAISNGNFGSEFILVHGTKEQKDRYLPPVCKGDYVSAAAFTEPNVSGSDLTKMETTATRRDREWLVNGTKTLITNATTADFILFLAQTDTFVKPTYRGETLFVVDKGTAGIKTVKLHNKMGIRCSETGMIRFNNMKITDATIVGELNRGFYHSMEFFDKTRVRVAAQALGMAQGAWEIAFNHSKLRTSFGKPILHHELIGCRLAEIRAKIEAARWLTYRAAWLIDAGKIDPMATAMAKQYASVIATETTDFAVQALGGYGYLGDYRVERYHRDAKVTEIYEGTSEIQKLIILKYLLANAV